MDGLCGVVNVLFIGVDQGGFGESGMRQGRGTDQTIVGLMRDPWPVPLPCAVKLNQQRKQRPGTRLASQQMTLATWPGFSFSTWLVYFLSA